MSVIATPASDTSIVDVRVWPTDRIPVQAKITLAVLVVFYLLSFADKQMFSLLANPVGEALKISDVQLGVLQGVAFSIFYSSGVLVAGWCVDRFQVRTLLFGAVVFWSLASAASGLMPGFSGMFAARGAVGLGEAFLPPAAYALLAATFPRDRIALANGIYHAGSNLGAVTTLLFGGLIIGWLTRLGTIDLPLVGTVAAWQAAFLFTGLPGVVIAFSAFALPRRVGAAQTSHAKVTVPLLPFIKRERLLIPCHIIAVALLAVLAYSLISWAPAFLGRAYKWSPERIGITLAVGSAAGGLGNIFWGWVADRLFRHGQNDAVYKVFIATTLCGMPVLAYGFASGNPDAFIYCYAFGWFTASCFGPLIAAAQLFTPPPLRGRVVALQTVAVGLFAIGLGPVIVAALAQYLLGGKDQLGPAIAITVVVCGAAGVALLAFARKPLRAAIERENIASSQVNA